MSHHLEHGHGEATAAWSWHAAKGKGRLHDLVEVQTLDHDEVVARASEEIQLIGEGIFLLAQEPVPNPKPIPCLAQVRVRNKTKKQRPRRPKTQAKALAQRLTGVLALVRGTVTVTEYVTQALDLALGQGGVLVDVDCDDLGRLTSARVQFPDGSKARICGGGIT